MTGLPGDIIGEIRTAAVDQVRTAWRDHAVYQELQKEIGGYLDRLEVTEEWAALQAAEELNGPLLFQKIRKNWKRDILPLVREEDSRQAESHRKGLVDDYMRLLGSQSEDVRCWIDRRLQDILDLIIAQVKKEYAASGLKEVYDEQRLDSVRWLQEDVAEMQSQLEELQGGQERQRSQLEKIRQERSSLVFFECPVVDNAIERTGMQESFSEALAQFSVLQILGPSASGKSTFARQYVYYYNETQENRAVYVEYSEKDSFRELERLAAGGSGRYGLVIVDFVKGRAPERWREDFFRYLEENRDSDQIKWMLFAQEAVFPEWEQTEYMVYGIQNKMHMLGVNWQEWYELAERYGQGGMDRDALEKAYRTVSAGKPGGVYIKDARLLLSLSEEEMWKAVAQKKQNITDYWEGRRFQDICGRYPEAALTACLLEPFSQDRLEEIEPDGRWRMVIQELHKKGLLILHQEKQYLIHETTRVNMEQSLSTAKLVMWHDRLACYCRRENLPVEAVMHLQRSGKMEEADALAGELFLRREYAGQVVGYVRRRALFTVDELIDILWSERSSYESYLLLREQNNEEISEKLFAILREGKENRGDYHSAKWTVHLILECQPQRWYELMYLGCEELGEESHLLYGVYFACRDRRLPIDRRIVRLIQEMYQENQREKCLLLCRIVFEQKVTSAYAAAWKCYAAVYERGKNALSWIEKMEICAEGEEELASILGMLCMEEENPRIRFFDEVTMRFVLEHQEELEPYCLRVLQRAEPDGELEQAVLVLLCYHHPEGIRRMKQELQSGEGKSFWQRTADCVWNMENWEIDLSLEKLFYDPENGVVIRMLCSGQSENMLRAAGFFVNRRIAGVKGRLMELLETQCRGDDRVAVTLLLQAAITNGATSEELHMVWEMGDMFQLWWVILMEREKRREVVPEITAIASDSGRDWQIRRQAVWALTELDGGVLREIALSILQENKTSDFDDSFDLAGHEVFSNMLYQRLWVLFNNDREGNIAFLAECYQSARGKAISEETAVEHARWLYEALESAGGVKNEEALRKVLDRLSYPLVQAAVLRGLRRIGERDLLEEVIAGSDSRWLVLRAVSEWCKIREEDWELPEHSFGEWEMVDRIVRSAAARKAENVGRKGTGRPRKTYHPIELVGYAEAMRMLQEEKPFSDRQYLDEANMTQEQREELQKEIRLARERNRQKEENGQDGRRRWDVMQLDGADYYMSQRTEYRSMPETGFLRSLSHLECHTEGEDSRPARSKREELVHLCIRGEKEAVITLLAQQRRLWYNELLDEKVEYALLSVVDRDFLPLLSDWSALGDKHLEIVCHLMQNISGASCHHFLRHLLHRVLQSAVARRRSAGGDGAGVELGRSLSYLLEHPDFYDGVGLRETVLEYLLPLREEWLGREMLDVVCDMPEAFVVLQQVRSQDREFCHYWRDRVEICSEALGAG